MNISLIFSLMMNLNFSVQFTDNHMDHQDYFIFTGLNSSVHLFRNESVVCLVHVCDNDYTRYEINVQNRAINYKWPLTVNDVIMKPIRGNWISSNESYTSFTFIDPVTITPEAELISINEDMSYDILIGILTIFVLISKLPEIVAVIRSRFKKERTSAEFMV